MIRQRYRRILTFFSRLMIGLVIWELVLPRLGLRRLVIQTRPARLRRIGSRYRKLAIQMGGVLIKVGQFLSSRLDVLPEEITTELAGLQDEVPAEDFAGIRRLAESELGSDLSERYATFEPIPLAAASLGQVHRATLKPGQNQEEGENVVVKVQRPGIEVIIATDLRALRTVGSWLQRYPPIRRRADIPALLDELGRVLGEEIDYLAEAANVEKFAANFHDRLGVRVPKVVWTHTTLRVLTLEDVYAIKITDFEAIAAAGIDRKAVAERLFQTYMQQIFTDGFVHADPHPGNLFVQPHPPPVEGGAPDWDLTFVDFGMVARVRPEHIEGLRELTIGLGTSDSGRMVSGFQKLGVLLPNADLELIRQAEARVFERMWGKSMAELRSISFDEMRQIGMEFRELIYQMPFQVPQELIFLVRTVTILSGMCTGLNPDFNLWESIAPYAQDFVTAEAGNVVLEWLRETVSLLQMFPDTMRRLHRALGQIEAGELTVRAPQISEQVSRLEFSVRRLVGALIFAALLLSGAQFYISDQQQLGLAFLGSGLIALIWVILSRR